MKTKFTIIAGALLLACSASAQVKISQLPAATTTSGTDVTILDQAGTTKQISIANLEASLSLLPAQMSLGNGTILVGGTGAFAVSQTPTGDLSMSNTGVFTLDTVNVTSGTYSLGNGSIIVNAKGLVTAITAPTDLVLSDGTSANPSWLTSLAWSKITGAPPILPTGTYSSDGMTFTFNGTSGILSGSANYSGTSGTAASAGAVPWTGITGSPITVSGNAISVALSTGTLTISSTNGYTDIVPIPGTALTTGSLPIISSSATPSAYSSGSWDGITGTAPGPASLFYAPGNGGAATYVNINSGTTLPRLIIVGSSRSSDYSRGAPGPVQPTWPDILGSSYGFQVINAGVSGENTTSMLQEYAFFVGPNLYKSNVLNLVWEDFGTNDLPSITPAQVMTNIELEAQFCHRDGGAFFVTVPPGATNITGTAWTAYLTLYADMAVASGSFDCVDYQAQRFNPSFYNVSGSTALSGSETITGSTTIGSGTIIFPTPISGGCFVGQAVASANISGTLTVAPYLSNTGNGTYVVCSATAAASGTLTISFGTCLYDNVHFNAAAQNDIAAYHNALIRGFHNFKIPLTTNDTAYATTQAITVRSGTITTPYPDPYLQLPNAILPGATYEIEVLCAGQENGSNSMDMNAQVTLSTSGSVDVPVQTVLWPWLSYNGSAVNFQPTPGGGSTTMLVYSNLGGVLHDFQIGENGFGFGFGPGTTLTNTGTVPVSPGISWSALYSGTDTVQMNAGNLIVKRIK